MQQGQFNQIIYIVAVDGGNGARISHTQFVKLGGNDGRRHAFGFIYHQYDFAPSFAQLLRNDSILRRQAQPAVDDE